MLPVRGAQHDEMMRAANTVERAVPLVVAFDLKFYGRDLEVAERHIGEQRRIFREKRRRLTRNAPGVAFPSQAIRAGAFFPLPQQRAIEFRESGPARHGCEFRSGPDFRQKGVAGLRLTGQRQHRLIEDMHQAMDFAQKAGCRRLGGALLHALSRVQIKRGRARRRRAFPACGRRRLQNRSLRPRNERASASNHGGDRPGAFRFQSRRRSVPDRLGRVPPIARAGTHERNARAQGLQCAGRTPDLDESHAGI